MDYKKTDPLDAVYADLVRDKTDTHFDTVLALLGTLRMAFASTQSGTPSPARSCNGRAGAAPLPLFFPRIRGVDLCKVYAPGL